MADPRVDSVTGRYLPVLYEIERPYWEAAKQHRLVLQQCGACGKVRFPIGPICPRCLSDEVEWTPMRGRGHVQSFVIYHKPWTDYYKAKVPYAVVQVELEEGPRLTTNLLGVPPAEVRIGMEVDVAFEDVTDDITLVQFAARKKDQTR